jgi:swainsonine biosynthesis oxidoreductase SwnR
MKVAVAGSGNLSQYISEEFPSYGHQVVFLTRAYKVHLAKVGCEQAVTDYSPDSLDDILRDCDVLISTIVDFSTNFIDIHLRLVAAACRSPTCKRFVPSEFTGDISKYPDQPSYFTETHPPIRRALEQQTDLEWTIVCIGLFADYVVPAKNRYLMDMREGNMIDFKAKQLTFPGTGYEPLDMVSARDVARALASLVNAPDWEPYTYISANRTDWWTVRAYIEAAYGEFSVTRRSLHQIITSVAANATRGQAADPFDILLEFAVSGATALPQDKVMQHRQKYFSQIEFRSIEALIGLANANPEVVL